MVNSKGRPFTNVSEAVARLHKKCGFTVAFTNRDARRSYETWSQNLPQKDDLAWYIAHSTEVAKRHHTAPDVHKATDGSLRSPPPTAPAPRSPIPHYRES